MLLAWAMSLTLVLKLSSNCLHLILDPPWFHILVPACSLWSPTTVSPFLPQFFTGKTDARCSTRSFIMGEALSLSPQKSVGHWHETSLPIFLWQNHNLYGDFNSAFQQEKNHPWYHFWHPSSSPAQHCGCCAGGRHIFLKSLTLAWQMFSTLHFSELGMN